MSKDTSMIDVGLTHIALEVSNLEKSIAFYQKYARMKVVHSRSDRQTQTDVAWLSDLTRPFVIVLLQVSDIHGKMVPSSHLGVGMSSREEVDYLCQQASEEGVLVSGPDDWGPPVGYWAYLRDPDGHTLEISFGQKICFTVEQAR